MPSATSIPMQAHVGPPPRRRRQVARATTVAAVSIVGLLQANPAYAQFAPGSQQPPGTQGLTTMMSWGFWLLSFICVAGILIVAAMMATKHRRGEGGPEAMGSLGWVLGACVLGSAAGPIANVLI